MYELMKLSGQEYVDIYAASLKPGVPGGQSVKPGGPGQPSARIPETAAG
jgi:1-acyl-sn-glycerol-3-phosphate acyltransferase